MNLVTEANPSLAELPPAIRELRQLVVSHDQRGNTYFCLDAGYRYLAQVGQDPQIVAIVLKGLLALGLGGPARELLDQRGDLVADLASAEFAPMRQAVAGAPTGRLPWSQTAATYAANCEALFRRFPRLSAHAAAITASVRNMQLWRSRDGRVHLSHRVVGCLRQWIPALSDYSDLMKTEIARRDLCRSTLVLGLGPHTLVESIMLATRGVKPNGAVPLVVVESRWEPLAAWLHSADRRATLEDPRLEIFAGPDAVAEFERFLLANDDVGVPTLRFTCHVSPDYASSLDDVTQGVTTERNRRFAELVEVHDVRCHGRSSADWAARLRPGARILGITSRFTTMLQHSMRDIGLALERAGYQFTRLMEAADHREHNSLTVRTAVHNLDPALVILINHLRYEHPNSYGGVPILTWIQDPMDNLLTRAAGASIGPHDFVCGYYRTQCTTEYEYPARQFLDHWVFPISASVFHDSPVSATDEERLACDLMYVGHYNGSPRSVLDLALQGYPAELHPLVRRAWEAIMMMHASGRHPDYAEPRRIVDQAAAELGVTIPEDRLIHLTQFLVMRTFDISYRQETLEWASRWAERSGRRFRIYGKGWESHPSLHRWAAGPLEHGEELRRACRAATLSLQTIHTGFAHQRSFEALACGSLVLARFSPWDYGGLSPEQIDERRRCGSRISGTVEMFPSLDRVIFRNEREFAAKADLYLMNPDVRRELVAEFRSVTLDEFTYEGVVPHLIAQVRDRLLGRQDVATA